jgi:hypothetical protein
MEGGAITSFDAYAAWVLSLRQADVGIVVPEKPWAAPAHGGSLGLAPRHRALLLEHLLEASTGDGAEPLRVLVAPSPSLICFAMGRTEGIVVDCGYTTCSVTELECATKAVATERVHMGGRDVVRTVRTGGSPGEPS